MAKTEAQQRTLDTTWSLHAVQSKSVQAAEMAHDNLLNYRHKEQSQAKDFEMLGELARQEVVLSNAAAYSEPSLVRAFPLLRRAAVAIQEFYPLSSSLEEARRRGNLWDHVHASDGAQLITLRDTLHVLQNLEMIDIRLSVLRTTLSVFLLELSREKRSRFALIALIESGTFAEAKIAYQEYVHNFVHVRSEFREHEASTAIGRMAARSLLASDTSLFLDCIHTSSSLFGVTMTGFKEFVKRVRRKSWHQQFLQHSSAYETSPLASLMDIHFVGLGRNETAELHLSNR